MLKISFLALFGMYGFQNIYSQNTDFNVSVLLKFANYTTFPEQHVFKNGNFTIGYIGKNDKFELLQKKLQFQSVDNKVVEVIPITSLSDLDSCNMIYFDSIQNQLTLQVCNFLTNKPILSITNNVQLLNYGVMFYFYPEDNTIRYLFNKNAIANSSLHIKSSILKPQYSFTNTKNE